MLTLDAAYEQNLTHWSDIQGHLEYMHDLVLSELADTVIELGVRSGMSTTAFLHALRQIEGGTLWSVDLEAPPMWDELGPVNWQIRLGDDMLPSISEALPKSCDILFVDTSHWYDHTLAELRLYGPRAKIILCHDTDLAEPWMMPPTDPQYPVRAAIDTYVYESERTVEYREGSYGLGVIR